jgi:YidC/Oxa1 family membrane protein insertase
MAKPDWVALESKYFACIILPFYEVKKILFEENKEEDLKQVLLALNTHEINPGETKTFAMRVYFGPKKMSDLKKLNNSVTRIIDFGFFAIISKPLFDVLNLFYKITRNYGVSILILTVLIKIIFYPLNKNQIKSMKRMKEIQPMLDEIKTKYKNDPKKMNQEYWAAMKKHKANPLGGCLPLVIQIPVFFALYNILINAIEMRHAAFLYIKDLSSADPYYISPILMGVSMVIQQRMTPSTVDPAQQKMMTLMPVIFTVIFLNMPSGLVIYWLASNVLTIAQQMVMTRKDNNNAHIKKAKRSGGKKWNR